MLTILSVLCTVLLPVAGLQHSAVARIIHWKQQTADHSTNQDLSKLLSQAQAGDVQAQLKLGQAYQSGNGVPKDDQQAAEWYSKAAEQGNAEAEFNLAVMYLTGQGVKQDDQQALKWFLKAAREGNATAMYNLGALYYGGNGIPVDDVMSYAWFTLANDAGYPKAAEAVQRAESDQKRSIQIEGYDRIARMYDAGDYLPLNHAEAYKWWLKAAAKNDPEAQVQVASKLLDGQGVPQDLPQARHWCDLAAEQHEILGQVCLGLIYRRGLGVAANPGQARKWFEPAAMRNNHQAIAELAQMEANGEGGKVDLVGASILYARLSATGDKDALKTLASLQTRMQSKAWKQVETRLLIYRIDPAKLEAALKQVASQ